MAWWHSHRGAREDCINNFKCYDCKRTYCDVASTAALRAVKAMLNKEKTKEETDKELSQFQGMGWGEPFQDFKAGELVEEK